MRRNTTAIVFDGFGTLLHYAGRRTNPYLRLVQAGEGEAVMRLLFLTRDVPVDVFAKELGLTYLVPQIHHELEVEISGLRLYPEVEEVIRRLRASGRHLAVCSNLAAAYGGAVHDLLRSMDRYIFSYEVGAAKPDPIIYQRVCDDLGCRPDQVLFIGDSKRCDYHGPQAFGMQARHLNRGAGQTLLDVLDDVL